MRIEDEHQVDLAFFTRLDLRQQQVGRQLLKLICDPQWDFAPTRLDNGKGDSIDLTSVLKVGQEVEALEQRSDASRDAT